MYKIGETGQPCDQAHVMLTHTRRRKSRGTSEGMRHDGRLGGTRVGGLVPSLISWLYVRSLGTTLWDELSQHAPPVLGLSSCHGVRCISNHFITNVSVL